MSTASLGDTTIYDRAREALDFYDRDAFDRAAKHYAEELADVQGAFNEGFEMGGDKSLATANMAYKKVREQHTAITDLANRMQIQQQVTDMPELLAMLAALPVTL